MSRGKVGVGVGVFIIKPDGSFLMGKRQNAHGHDSWSVPGGWLEFGESWEQAAKREVMEETGLKILKPVEFVAVTNDYFKKDNQHSHTIWLRTEFSGGHPKILEPDKLIELNWFSFNGLPSPLFQPCWENLRKSKPELFQ